MKCTLSTANTGDIVGRNYVLNKSNLYQLNYKYWAATYVKNTENTLKCGY